MKFYTKFQTTYLRKLHKQKKTKKQQKYKKLRKNGLLN